MKKVAIASLLTVSAVSAFSMTAVSSARAQAAAGQIQMEPAEFADYDNAVNKQTTPQTQAPAIEAYLTKYPKSVVKADVLQRLMIDYSKFDPTKTIDAADRVLQVTPGNPQALFFEAYFRSQVAQALTDTAAKQAGMDVAASYAQKDLDVAKPAGLSDADFASFKTSVAPTLYSTIGNAASGKGDYAAAIAAYKSELAATPVEQTQVAGTAPAGHLLPGQCVLPIKARRPGQLHVLCNPRGQLCAGHFQGSAAAASHLLLQEVPRRNRWLRRRGGCGQGKPESAGRFHDRGCAHQ